MLRSWLIPITLPVIAQDLTLFGSLVLMICSSLLRPCRRLLIGSLSIRLSKKKGLAQDQPLRYLLRA